MKNLTEEIAPHLPRLRRYARSLLRDSVRADDLVQDTVVRALEKAHLYQHDTNLRGWLVTIMHNEHVNAARRLMRGPTYVSDDAIGELGRPQNQEAPVELREVRRAVERLPDEQRAPLLLHWLHGFRYEEIAAKMGLPLGTVQSRISRARKALRAMIEAPGSRLGVAHRSESIKARPARRVA